MVLNPRGQGTGFFKPENRLFAGIPSRFFADLKLRYSRREDFYFSATAKIHELQRLLACTGTRTTFYMRDSYYFHRVFTRFHDIGFGGFQLRNSCVTCYSLATDCDGSIWFSCGYWILGWRVGNGMVTWNALKTNLGGFYRILGLFLEMTAGTLEG